MSAALSPIPVVIDTDVGTDADDALAIVLALASPELDLVGLTIVDGDVDTRARLAARLLGMAGRPDIPIYKGASRPIGVGRMPTWFGHEGEGVLDTPWDGPEAEIHDQPAAEWLIERSRTDPFHLAAIGPFTNVAHAVQLDATFPDRILGLTVMGGMVHPDVYLPQWQQFFRETGLPPNHMDHNAASDVEASLIMARAGFDMTWVTAELTFCTTLHADAMARFSATGTILGARLAEVLRIWSSRYFHVIPNFPLTARPFPPDAVAALHDPLAVASIFGGEWLSLRKHNLRFGEAEGLFRIEETVGAAEAVNRISTAVDRAAFEAFVVDRLERHLRSIEEVRPA